MPEDLSRRWMEYDDKSATAVRRNLRSIWREMNVRETLFSVAWLCVRELKSFGG